MIYRFFLLFTFLSLNIFNAQIFTWKNPNLPAQDSLKTDSIVSKKLNSEFFKRDTANFVWKEKKILYDESVLVKKNSLSQILGDLNAKGSIIRGITFGNNQGQSVQSSMDMQIA